MTPGTIPASQRDIPTPAILLTAARLRAVSRMPMKTYVAKPTDRERNWLVVDAEGQTLGRLATQIADALRGSASRPTPRTSHGRLRRRRERGEDRGHRAKRAEKMYYRHSGYPGGLNPAR